MPDYSAIATRAGETLERFGQTVTLRTVTVGAYDPATGAASSTTADSTYVGAIFDFSSGVANVRGSLVAGTDKQLYLDPAATVSMEDYLIVDSKQYAIVSIGEINPAGTRVLYDLHLRAS